LYPMLCTLRDLPFLPKGPIYLLIDDAHNLTTTQAVVLNTCVSTRTSSRVSLKISTQPGYETYYTISKRTIETPHDFSEVNNSSTCRPELFASLSSRLIECLLKPYQSTRTRGLLVSLQVFKAR